MRRLAPARLVAEISTAALLLALPSVVCRKALAQIPPPPIQVPFTPTLASPFQDAVEATVEGNEVIQSIMSARGSDPTKWFIPPKAMPVPELRPIALPTMHAMIDKLSALKAERKRLQLLLDADGVLNAIQGMSCAIGVQNNVPIQRLTAGTPETDSEGEGLADEIGSLNIALANTRREIDEIEHSPEFARRRYISCLRASGVSINDNETLPAAGEQRLYPRAASQTNTSVQAKEFKDCSPRLENYTSHVLAPRMVGFNRANVAQYNWQWVTVTRSRMTKPDGC